MKIVNKTGIPESLYRFLSQDNYDYAEKGNSISATDLLKPIQPLMLRRRYDSQLTVEAADQLWKLFGSGVHAVLEWEKGIEKIKRMKVEVLGRDVSGKFDRVLDGKITDYKVTSAWSLVYGSREEDWNLQLSIYRWLYYKTEKKELEPKGAIVAILRDWSAKNTKPNKYGKENRYPKAPAIEIVLELKSIEETEKIVTERVTSIIEAEKLEDDKLPECSDADRWYNKEKREYLRCGKYCEVAAFCHQLRKEKELESIELAEVVGEKA